MPNAESPTKDSAVAAPPADTPASDAPAPAGAGGSRELLVLAFPLVISQSFFTIQVFLDTQLLSWHDPDEMTASLPAVMMYWQFFGLLQVAAGYTSTFVAQYTGAGRPHRTGPAVWQGVYFAVAGGLLFLLLIPFGLFLIGLAGHSPAVRAGEEVYFRCLCFAALPMLVVAAVNGFFSGRGDTLTVLAVDAFGVAVNIALALVLIFGEGGVSKLGLPGVPGVPAMGIEGAGWATVAGSWAAALLAVGLFLRRKFRAEFGTAAARLEPALFLRLLRYGGPAGMQLFLDVAVFNLFIQLVGRLGDAAQGATTLTFRLNMFAFMPMLGLGMAISILVGQRLGESRPDLAERSTYTGLRWMAAYGAAVAAVYLLLPATLAAVSRPDDPAKAAAFDAIAAIVPSLLVCVAAYSVADAVNLAFAFALRGAGDTLFVTVLTFVLAWPIMVVPTYFVVTSGGSVYWAWGFATAFIGVVAVCFWLRFRSGVWKTRRVIEPGVTEHL